MRQTEFGKQMGPVPPNYPTYGNMIIGPATATAWLRVVERSGPGGTELYTAYSSNDENIGRTAEPGSTRSAATPKSGSPPRKPRASS